MPPRRPKTPKTLVPKQVKQPAPKLVVYPLRYDREEALRKACEINKQICPLRSAGEITRTIEDALRLYIEVNTPEN